ncbi:cytochrome c [Altererythrobacter sp. CC-YST694]|uniref:c-type cytochrome n=1 Tax=Altererythrobacter sp. CC-YST694 TaxID=2755038 RepID=UPI001D009020|nr:cytochrome c [Altererythrobacter sp. CC-YST694]MCB5426637.1 cytochrome c [Altererythrobacter sp. CC-YST694]
MSKPLYLAAGALLLGTFAACSGGAEEAPATPAPRAGPAPAPDPVTLAMRPNAQGGEKAYVEKCIMCHGANGMGSGLLARRMDVPDLEARKDLDKSYVILAARHGIGNMPAIPRGEVSDAELGQIAEYLASGKGPAGGSAGGAQ